MFASASLDLADLGWDDAWAATLATAVQLLGRAEPGRVARVDVGVCTVFSTDGPRRVGIPPGITVAVGDWVVVRAPAVAGALPRRTAIVRRSAGLDPRGQTLAANVDTVLVLVAAVGRVTPRSVERYVTLVWESGGLEDLTTYFGRGRTVALLGPSGAGKSTLANHLAGAALATGAVRGDGRGRHTTTHRELLPLPGGGLLVDTPGLREVGLWDAADGVARTFPEITALLDQCRFTDCSQRREPGCAVLAAVADGRVSEERLASWRKLHRELDRLTARDDPALAQQLRTEQRRLYREYAQARKQWRKGR